MDKAVWHRRIEDHVQPVTDNEHPIFEYEACRRVHPTVRSEYPEGGHHGSCGNGDDSRQIQTTTYTAPTEEQDSQKRRFEEERREDLVRHQGAKNVAGCRREARPVHPQLVAHDDAGNDPHRERQRKQLEPEIEQSAIAPVSRAQPPQLQHKQVACDSNRERGKQNMERDRKRELETCQQDRISDVHRAAAYTPAPSRVAGAGLSARHQLPGASSTSTRRSGRRHWISALPFSPWHEVTDPVSPLPLTSYSTLAGIRGPR